MMDLRKVLNFKILELLKKVYVFFKEFLRLYSYAKFTLKVKSNCQGF